MDMNDIMIKIKGSRFVGDSLEEEMEFVSDGTTFCKDGDRYFLYDESEFSGFSGCKTSLKISDGKIRMRRLCSSEGDFKADLVFEQGKRFVSKYMTPFGELDMEVLTSSIENNISPEGLGTITLDYDVSLHGLSEGRNRLDIEVTKQS